VKRRLTACAASFKRLLGWSTPTAQEPHDPCPQMQVQIARLTTTCQSSMCSRQTHAVKATDTDTRAIANAENTVCQKGNWKARARPKSRPQRLGAMIVPIKEEGRLHREERGAASDQPKTTCESSLTDRA